MLEEGGEGHLVQSRGEAVRWGLLMTVCESFSTPIAVWCTMRIVHCSVEPGAGFGRPAERQREGNKNSEIKKESDGETEGKGNRKRTEAEH